MRFLRGSAVRRIARAVPITLPVLLIQACGAGWHRTDIVTPESPRQQVEVWQGQAAQQWHAVRVTDSTVSGIPFVSPIECESCRQTVARTTVDSVRLGNPVAGLWKSVGLIVGIPTLLILIIYGGFPSPGGT